MLSEKSWRLEPMARLFLSVVLCVFIGPMLLTGVDLFMAPRLNWKLLAMILAALAFLVGALVLVRRQWDLESFRRRALVFLTLIYAGMIFGWLIESRVSSAADAGSTTGTIVRILCLQGAALVWVRGFLREHQTSWTSAFGLANKRTQAVLIGIAVACFFLPIAQLIQAGSLKLIGFLTHAMGSPFRAEDQAAVQALRHAHFWGGFAVLAVETIFLVPVAEEVLFRGILYSAIRQAGFKNLALWVSALAFGGIHMDLERFLPLFTLGIVLALLYEKTNNLLTSITAHSVFNTAGVIYVYLINRQINS